ncbi:MAG TPA: ABC transporter ATP-binding protein [Anaerolineales bacterium]|nr:ABC transporter ATP-binding protein [Anaerolineales bacterium]
MNILAIKDISKSFGSTRALRRISFEVSEGEIVALLGPSGCGKSTLLSIIAGLEIPDQGDVMWKGESLARVPAHLRGFGLMFQDFALFPHMNVYANVAFGLKMAHLPEEQVEERVNEMLRLVGLHHTTIRDVNTLSGGEQQRVALARALAPHPRLLMLDEPLGSLDRNLRERLLVDLQSILHQMQQTAIYVTHDQEEAFAIADRIILMNAGQIEQVGKPQEIYCDPASVFVARFLEMTNILPASILKKGDELIATTSIGDFPVNAWVEGDAQLLIRPDVAQMDNSQPVIIKGKLMGTSFRGSRQRVTLQIQGTQLSFDFPSANALPVLGEELTISLDPSEAVKIFPA